MTENKISGQLGGSGQISGWQDVLLPGITLYTEKPEWGFTHFNKRRHWHWLIYPWHPKPFDEGKASLTWYDKPHAIRQDAIKYITKLLQTNNPGLIVKDVKFPPRGAGEGDKLLIKRHAIWQYYRFKVLV